MPLARYQPGPTPAATSSSSSRTTPSRSASAKRKNSAQGDEHQRQASAGAPFVAEEFGPPDWRPVLSSKADLGYPDFYPSRPGFHQLEDVLTEENVKLGFQPKASIAVSSEGFSMHGMIHSQLTGDALGKLDALAYELLAKRDESMPTLGPRTYRLPPRVTYNDIKRLAYIADLANPTVPLYKLARQSVPHGYKGIDLLETMWSPAPPVANNQPQAASSSTAAAATPPGPVPMDRAAWFIRVLGANEVVVLRNRPANANALAASWTGKPLTPSQQYTVEFTGVYTAFLRKQLMDLVLPQTSSSTKAAAGSQGASGAALGKQSTGGGRNAGVLGDTAARARWVAKWDYSLELLRTLHGRYLISSRSLATWLAEFATTCNLAQIGFIAQLVEEYMTDVTKHVPLARLVLRAILDKLAELRKSPAQEHLSAIVVSCIRIVQAFFYANSDIMLSPTTWSRHSSTLHEIILCQAPPTSSITGGYPQKLALDQESPASTSTTAISGILGDSSSTHTRLSQRTLMAQFNEIRDRNERLLSRSVAASPSSMSPRRQAMADIQKLDSLSATTQINDFMTQYFDGPSSPTSASLDYAKLEEKVHILLVWALSVFTLGDHRPYAVCTLLKKWQDAYVSHRPPDAEGDIDLFRPLFSWLDNSEAAQKNENIPAIALSFGELTREGIFSYGRYLQLLIAKGYTSRAASQGASRSHHLDLLEAMPIFVQDKGMLLQRRIVLYGLNTPLDREKLKTEAETQARLRDEIARIVPEIYGGSVNPSLSTDWNPSDLARTSSRYELVQARFWIFPLSVAFIDRLSPSSFVRMLNFFESCRGYATVLDFILRALKAPVHNAVLNITLDTVRRGAEVWTAMDRQGQLATALLEKFTRLRSQGHFNSALWKQLKYFTQQGYLPAQAVAGRRMSLQYATEFATALPKVNSLPSMTEICKASSSEEVDAAVPAYQSSGDRTGRLTAEQWREILQSFLPGSQADPRHICAFLAGMESASGTETTGVIYEWLEQQTPQSRVRLFSPPTLHPTLRLLVQLVAVGCLQTTTFLSALIFPLWTTLAEASPTDAADLNTIISATTSVASQLLLVSRSSAVKMPNFDIMEVKTLETSRADAFRDPDAIRLVRHLPLLVVLENEVELRDDTRDAVSALRLSLSLVASFRTAAFRHLELLKDVFLAPVWARHRIPALDARMIDALKAIMTDGGPSKPRSEQALPPWSRNTARYSAWRWTRTVLELRLSFKQLAVRIMQGEEVDASRKALRELAQSMFSNDVNNDETDLICEAFRGVESVAVEQVVTAGMDHLTSLIDTLSLEAHDTSPADPAVASRSIENVVRMLQSIIEVHTQTEDLPVDASGLAVRERLSVGVASLLRSIASSLRISMEVEPRGDAENLSRIGRQPLRPLLTRLSALIAVVKFYLVLPTTLVSSSSPKARQSLADAAISTLDIIWHLPSYGPETGTMAELLADLHSYMVDELPREAKPAMQSALNKIQAANGNPDRAPCAAYLKQVLPYESPPRRAMTLVDPDVGDTSWHYDDRPWETSEQLEPSERSLHHGDSFLDPTPLANNSSIPLSAFDAKLCRDRIPVPQSEPWTAYASERSLGNGLVGEPQSAAVQATTIFNGDFQAARPTAVASEGLLSATSPSVASTYTREQPEVKGQSQPNGTKSSGQSTHDPIEIDDDDDDDDDIEVIPPPAKRPRTSISKSSTGSKTVARKAPQKAAKAPASTRGKGRRKSQVE